MPALSEKTPITPVRRQNTALKTEMNEPALTVHVTPIARKLSELEGIDQIKSNYDDPNKLKENINTLLEITTVPLPSGKFSKISYCEPHVTKAYSSGIQLRCHDLLSDNEAS